MTGGPDVAIAHRFRKPPYGGSNQFLLALRDELRRRGFSVGANRIGRRTQACILNAFAFDAERVRRQRRNGCRIVHRVDGPVARYRGFDDGTDRHVKELNDELADVTVFQSRYSLEAHLELGLELEQPVLIPNAVDPRLFYPAPRRPPVAGRTVRLITTSWSDNPNKGIETFRWLDEHLDRSRYEYTFVGQLSVPLRRTRTVEAVPSERVGELLREHDVYVAASRYDPCSNALLEALACGLPALYADSGGHSELVGDGGLRFTAEEELPGRLERIVAEYDDRKAAISIPSIGDVADRYLDVMGVSRS
jgi:glycosyltransferase involved in cell wall biosynthesis